MLTTKFKINDSASKRSKDDNGYLIVKDNPIAVAGIFEYLEDEILGNGSDKIVKVYRPFEDLEKNKDKFKNMPIVWEHKWVGDETQQADGVIGGEVKVQDNCLVADLIFYNKDLINAIENGECIELSPGFTQNSLKEVKGNFNGDSYEYEMLIDYINHLAVVPYGRAGDRLKIEDKGVKKMSKDLSRIFSNLAKILDKKSIKDSADEMEKMQTQDECKTQDNINEVAQKILEISKADVSDDDKMQGILEVLSSLNVTDEEAGVNPDEKKEDEDLEKEKSMSYEEIIEPVKSDLDETKALEIIEAVVEKVADKHFKKIISQANLESKKISDSYSKVKNVIGSFDYVNMSESEIYRYGYRQLTQRDLAQGLDPKTAFTMEAEKLGFANKVVDSSSTQSKEKQSIMNEFKSRFGR